MTEMPHADQVRNHARWRPGWTPGRTSYAWLLPLADQADLRHLVNRYQYALRELPGFDLVPLEWMHILVQEIGFTDETAEADLTRARDAVRERLTGVAPLVLAFHHAVVLPESLALPAEPRSSLLELRATVRQATAEVLGKPALPPEPEDTDKHVSLARATAKGPAIFAVSALKETPVEPTTVKVSALALVRLNRALASSEWETVAEIPFGG